MASKEESAEDGTTVIQAPIVREASFVRLTADTFFPYHLTDTVEIALLLSSPDISGQAFQLIYSDQGSRLSPGGIDPSPSFVEVARLRLDSDGVNNLLVVALGAAKSSGLVPKERLRSILSDALDSISEAD